MKQRVWAYINRYMFVLTAVILLSAAFIESANLREVETEKTVTEEISGVVECAPIEETAEVIEETTEVVEEIEIAKVTSETEPTEQIETQPEETTYYTNIPLDEKLQTHIISECEKVNIDPAIIFAVIKRESGYIVEIMGDNGRSYGLMQIQLRWHSGRMEKLGCTNLLDPFQNVTVGINYLSELYDFYGDIGLALTAYNGGYKYADKYKAKDMVSNYAQAVLTEAERITNG